MDRKWLLENFPPQKQLLHLGAEFHSISKYFTAFKKFEMSHKLYRAKNLERPSFCILHTRLSWILKMSSDDVKNEPKFEPKLEPKLKPELEPKHQKTFLESKKA